MTQNRIRTALMDATVKVVARDGLEKLTTRSIANECELHDTYIYRYFLDKVVNNDMEYEVSWLWWIIIFLILIFALKFS